MAKKSNTKKALLMSALSLLLCVSMLVGTTFAWFTDTVTSGTNVIAAGNLDVELTHTDKAATDETVDGNVILFDDVELWEPGAVAYEKLTISNVGSLALKYNFAINVAKANGVLGDGKVYTLADVLKVAVVPAEELGSREKAIAAGEGNWKPLASWFESGNLYPEEGRNTDTYGIVIYWEPSENDNIFNMNNGKTTTDGGKQLTIELGVHLVATQLVHENDSYGDDYDKGAFWTGDEDTNWYSSTETEFVISTAEELAGFASLVNSGADTFDGKTVKLGADIDLNGVAWTPIGNNADGWNNKFNGSFIGTGYTISNLSVTGTTGLGLFGYVGNTAHIEGVTIDGAYVSGNDYVGAVVGTGYLASDCLKNCTVKNATIIATPYLTEAGIYDGGAKAGAVAGFVSNGKVIGNKAENCTIIAYRDLGGIVGMVQGENYTVDVYGNSVDGITLKYFDLNGAAYDGDTPNQNMGNIVGRQSTITLGDNTENNVKREVVVTYTKDGIQYIKDVDADEVTLFKVTEDYESTIVEVPEGVTTIGSYAFAYNSNIETIKLSSSVKTLNDQAFRGTSASTVVLNEGLTVISYKAFRDAKNLTTVEIPATVTTIKDSAFQLSGITTLTIPETVTTIENGACRDMEELTTVTIKGGAVTIPTYAFRTCKKLTSVYLDVDTVTLGDGMIFTNTESNNENPNNITIYVFNDDVYNTLTDDADVKCTVVKASIVDAEDEAQDFTTILKNAKDGDVIYLTAGEHAVNNYNVGAAAANLTIIGEPGATISVATDSWSGSWKNVFGINFDNLTLRNLVVSDMIFSGKVTFDNCTFTNGFTGSEGDLDFTITNCTMNGRLQFSNSGTSKISVSGVTVTEAEFYSKGGVEFTDCTIEGAMIPWDTNTVLTNCSVGEYNCENNGEYTLVVDGEYYAGNAAMLKAAVDAGATEVNLLDGEYDVYGCGGKTLTINGSKNAVLKLKNEGEDGCDYSFGSSGTGVGNITFNGVTIDTTENNGNYKGYAYMKGTFNDCTFVGAYSLNNANDFAFNRCTFDFKDGYFWVWSAKKVTFNDCEFGGNSKAILAHGWESSVININNCDFVAAEKGYAGGGKYWTAAIEIDPAGSNTYTINFTGENTITESYSGWIRVKDDSTGHVITYPTEVTSAADLTTALNKGQNVELTEDVTAPLSGSAIYGTPVAAVQKNGGVIDGNGNSLDIENPQYNGYAIETWGGTIQNLTIDSTVGRGIVISSPKEDIYIGNVVIDGPGYAINTTEHSAKKMIVTNSTIKGWTSFAGLDSAYFTNCIFGENTSKYWQNMGYDQDYDRLIRPYVTTVFTDCEFEKGFYIDLSALGEGCKITLTDCFCGDVEITADNYTQFITIELPTGRTLADCVTFN